MYAKRPHHIHSHSLFYYCCVLARKTISFISPGTEDRKPSSWSRHHKSLLLPTFVAVRGTTASTHSLTRLVSITDMTEWRPFSATNFEWIRERTHSKGSLESLYSHSPQNHEMRVIPHWSWWSAPHFFIHVAVVDAIITPCHQSTKPFDC